MHQQAGAISNHNSTNMGLLGPLDQGGQTGLASRPTTTLRVIAKKLFPPFQEGDLVWQSEVPSSVPTECLYAELSPIAGFQSGGTQSVVSEKDDKSEPGRVASEADDDPSVEVWGMREGKRVAPRERNSVLLELEPQASEQQAIKKRKTVGTSATATEEDGSDDDPTLFRKRKTRKVRVVAGEEEEGEGREEEEDARCDDKVFQTADDGGDEDKDQASQEEVLEAKSPVTTQVAITRYFALQRE
jgi:hypothetical protein